MDRKKPLRGGSRSFKEEVLRKKGFAARGGGEGQSVLGRNGRKTGRFSGGGGAR